MINKKQAILIFIALTYLLTWICCFSKNLILNAVAQASPALVVAILLLFSGQIKREIKAAGLVTVGNIKWYGFAILVPFFAIVFSYTVGTWLGFFSFQLHLPWPVFLEHFLLLIFMWPLIWAIGEEMGWRGFLQPKLTELIGIQQGILVTGVIWATWHLFFILLGGYFVDGNLFIDISLFFITVILMSFFIGWIRIRSNSVWPCVIFHSASNAAWQMCSAQFKVIHPYAIYFAGEAGIINIIFWLIGLLFIWQKLR